MPAVRIKSRANAECLWTHDLHTCRKSPKLTKISQAQTKAFPQEAALDTFLQTHQDGEPYL